MNVLNAIELCPFNGKFYLNVTFTSMRSEINFNGLKLKWFKNGLIVKEIMRRILQST